MIAQRFAPPAVDCSRRTVRCANAREYNSELNACCRSHQIEIMTALVSMASERGVRLFADYGTLLGAVRNPMTRWADYPWLRQDGRTTDGPAPGIVPHDKDGDLGGIWEDWNAFRQMRPALERMGFSVRLVWARGAAKIFYSRTNHTNVDVFFWLTRKNGTMYRKGYAQVDQFKGREFPSRDLLPFSTVTWEGLTLNAPRDPEAFLAMRYGPNWRTPIMANNDGVKR